MEAVISVIYALGGLVFGLMFLLDLPRITGNCGGGRGSWLKAGVKLLVALLLLHFHFELDILD